MTLTVVEPIQLDGAAVYIDTLGIATLDHVILDAPNDAFRDFLIAIKRLSRAPIANTSQAIITIASLQSTLNRDRTTILRRIKSLEDAGIVISHEANSIDNITVSKRSIYIYSFVDIMQIDEAKIVKEFSKFIVDASRRNSDLSVISQLSENNIQLHKDYKNLLKTQKESYTVPIPQQIENLISPAQRVELYRAIDVIGDDGEIRQNTARSAFGIVNDFDRLTLDIMSTMTLAYISALNRPITPDEAVDLKIPIYINTLTARHGLSPTMPNKVMISKSILRIQETRYRMVLDGNFDDGEETSNNRIGLFSFLDPELTVIGKNRTYSDITILQDNSNASTVDEIIEREWGEDLPFVCIELKWTRSYYKRLINQKDNALVLDTKTHQLRSTLYTIYRSILRDLQSEQSAWFLNKKQPSFQTTLYDLVLFIWPNEADESINRLIVEIISDIKKTRNFNTKLVVSETMDNEGVTAITLDMFEFQATFIIPSINEVRSAANVRNTIISVVHQKNIIKKALPDEVSINLGLEFNPGNALPKKKRRKLPKAIAEVKRFLDEFRVRTYTIYFKYDGEEYQLSPLSQPNEYDYIFDRIAIEKELNISLVRLFFDFHIASVQPMPFIDNDVLDRISRVTLLTRGEVLTFLIGKSFMFEGIPLMTDLELKEFFKVNQAH